MTNRKEKVCTGANNQQQGMDNLSTSIQQQTMGKIALTCTIYALVIIDYTGKRKKRCFNCSGCLAADCGTCKHCLDKPKFGGKGVRKQCCVKRKCIRIFSGK